jgi:ATP-dependent Lhr-like helicase
VAAADFLRFLFKWQRLATGSRAEGPEGLAAVLDVLDGYELAAGAWESEVLPARLTDYDPLWLDGLCLSGEIAWGRLTATRNAEVGMRNRKVGPVRSTPIALFRRERGEIWRAGNPEVDPTTLPLSSTGKALLQAFESRGALFFGDLVNATGLLRTEVEKGLAELVAWGLVSSDSFAGMRALLVPSDRRRPLGGGYRRRGRIAPFGVETAGRWARTHGKPPIAEDQVAEAIAWQLLRRYGVVFRRLVQRETLLAPWRDILRVYRRLEARGEIRGGRFVGGFSGEQYALPEAIGLLRSTRREQQEGELIAVSGADPLNLVGILTPDDAVPAIATNRILYRDGVPIVVKEGEGKSERFLVDVPAEERDILRGALLRRRPAPLVRAYLGKSKAG